VIKPDGTCPSCRAVVGAASTSQVDAATLSGSSPRGAPADRSAHAIEATNPYQSPLTVSDELAASNFEQGLVWILFSFEGRIPRRVFWAASLGTGAVFYVALVTIATFVGDRSMFLLFLLLGLYIPTVWASLAIQAKRWHDRDKSGWWVFIGIVPVIGPIWQFVETGCLRGTVGPNQFGRDPT